MPLPPLIEIEPLSGPVTARITVPGSKSITNRALILAALGEGPRALRGALWSEDTQVMVGALTRLGFHLEVTEDPLESCNRTIRVEGRGGTIPAMTGSQSEPVELFVGNAGTAARFLSALVCLGTGAARLDGSNRMRERPQAALFDALRQLGYRIDAANNRLPAVIHSDGPKPGHCEVSVHDSSQFASALLLCASRAGWEVSVFGENAEESPYVAMTIQLMEKFQKTSGDFDIEPDASSGSYFWAADWLLNKSRGHPERITVQRWPISGWQVDARFPDFLPLPKQISRRDDLGDSIMTGIVLAPFAGQLTAFTDLGRLRLQETERVRALRIELGRMYEEGRQGTAIREEGDTLTICPGPLQGAVIRTYDDHRMAMCFSLLGLQVPGVRIDQPECVKKTFPSFYQKLAAAPPAGLGAKIRAVENDRPLSPPIAFSQLFAT